MKNSLDPDRLDISAGLTDGDLVTWVHRGDSDKLVICFSGIGKAATDVPPYEFAKAATGNGQHNVLFISDPNRTWLNGDGLLSKIQSQIEAFKAICGARRCIAMGHSMGGFSALITPSLTHIDDVLAFAPQISVAPDVAPNETRWANYRERITDFKVKSAVTYLQDDTNYTIVSGKHPREAPQRDLVPSAKNIRHYALPNTHHNVPMRLKNMGCLNEVVGFAIEGRPRMLKQRLKAKANAIWQG